MKYLIFISFLVLISCKQVFKTNNLTLDEIFNSKFEHSLISRGDNFPNFNSRNDSIDLFLVSLHNNLEIKDFQNKSGWTDNLVQNKVDFLKSNNWLQNKNGLKPTVFIASNAEGLKLMELAKPISNEIAKSIIKEIPKVKEKYSMTELSQKQNFSSMSFLILSNVLLDNWQINQVEKKYLNKDKRPERHGKYYYYSIIQNPNYPKEKFGIYGNKFSKLNDSTYFNIYGNNRIVLLRKIKSDSVFRDSLYQNAPYISARDDIIFEQMAESFLPKLITILNDNHNYIKKVYHKTGYSKEISFEEFFIWWYHLIYTEATNILALNGVINIPKDGNFSYMLEI